MAKIIEDIQIQSNDIYNARIRIAELKKEKIIKRASAWDDATGIADQKKDYVRSIVAEIDESIDKEEAKIEFAYNKMKVLNYQLENTDE